MPVYKQRVVLELVRNLRAFLNLELSLARGPVSNQSGAQSAEVESLRKQLEVARRQLESSEHGGVGPRTWREDDAIDPGKMVWIFGTGRSGSTWLRSIMSETKESTVWEEPMVGRLFGKFYNEAQTGQLDSPKFILENPTRSAWIKSIRNFVLDGARWTNPRLRNGQYLVIKEPNGSEGAPLLMEALPESRMIFLVRDPRDVVASVVDGAREGSWLHGRKDEWVWRATSPDMQADRFVEHRAKMYMRHVEGARQAYEIHKCPTCNALVSRLYRYCMGLAPKES